MSVRLKILKPLLLLLFFSMVIPSMAVTKEEMEQARTITAFWYLRFANNGAGYMEEVKMPSTMAGLEKILKPIERDNLKAFNAVKTPDDYASWDKAKLVAYWGDTFFTSPGLSDKGKVARSRVKNKLNAMKVAAPAPAPVEEPAPVAVATDASKPVAPATTAEAVPGGVDSAAAEADQIIDAAVAIDSAEIEAEQTDKARRKAASDNTWIYIGVLVLLVGVVIWLVIFASKTMQEGNRRKNEAEDEEEQEVAPVVRVQPTAPRRIPETLPEAPAVKQPVKAPVVPPVEANPSAEVRALNREVKSLREECLRLGQENGRLEVELDSARREIENLQGRLRAAVAAVPAVAPKSEVAATPRPASSPARPAAPVAERAAAPVAEPENEAREIYLGRVNPKGLFVRADRRPVPDKSVFVLTTTDGYTGTYRILQIAEVIERCLDNPDHYLAGGCTAPDILATEDAAQIRTLQPGTAIFENGCWRMIRKTKIVYE